MSGRRYKPPGHKGACEIAEYGWPPMREPYRDAESSEWQKQSRNFVQFRDVETGLMFGVHRSRLAGLEPLEGR